MTWYDILYDTTEGEGNVEEGKVLLLQQSFGHFCCSFTISVPYKGRDHLEGRNTLEYLHES